MSVIASQLIARVSTMGVSQSIGELESVGAASDSVGHKLSTALTVGALVGGAALLGVGFAATKMAGDFQAGVTTLVTGAGELERNVGLISAGILKMAVTTGTSTTELTKGLYMIESAGFHGAAGLAILQAAAEGAKVGEASLADVANGVTTIMVDYAAKHITAAQATNILIAAVAAGKTHMQDLATALSTILPTSSAVGVSMTDTAAALATMTSEGTDAASAATYLRQMLLAMEAPSTKAQKVLAEIGLTSQQVADEMRVSLPDALQMITDAIGRKFTPGSAAYVAALKDMAGGQKNFQGWLELTGQHLATFKADVVDITSKVKAGGTAVTGWALVQKDFNFQVEQAHAALDVFLIQLGTSLLPLVSELIGYFTANLLPRLADFSAWFKADGVPALQQFGTIIGTTVTDLMDFAKWLNQGTPPAQALRDAAIALGIAIATVKIGLIVSDMKNFIGAVPEMLGKMFLVQEGAEGIAGAKGLGAIAPASTEAEGAIATASSGMKLSLLGVLGAIGLVAGAEIGLAKWIRDNNIVPTVKAAGGGVDNNPAWVTHINQAKVLADALKTAAQQAKDLQNQIDQAWKDMEGLGDWATKHQRILGDITDPVALTKDDIKLQEIHTHLDDIAKPYEPKIITADIERGRLKIIEFKSRIDDIKVPASVGIITPQVDAARLKVIELKTRADDLKGPVSIGVITPEVEAARLKVVELKARLDDTKGPFIPSIGTQSIDAATSHARYLKSQLDNLSAPISINVGGFGGTGGFASGVSNNPIGQWSMVGERGPEAMYVPRGASILPHGTPPPASGNTQPVIVNVYLAGAPVAKALMPHIAQQIRQATGAKF